MRRLPRWTCALLLIALGITKIVGAQHPEADEFTTVGLLATAVELALGTHLLTGRHVLFAATAATVFAAVLLVALLTAGRLGMLTECGCLGTLSSAIGIRVLIAASLLALSSLTIWVELAPAGRGGSASSSELSGSDATSGRVHVT